MDSKINKIKILLQKLKERQYRIKEGNNNKINNIISTISITKICSNIKRCYKIVITWNNINSTICLMIIIIIIIFLIRMDGTMIISKNKWKNYKAKWHICKIKRVLMILQELGME